MSKDNVVKFDLKNTKQFVKFNSELHKFVNDIQNIHTINSIDDLMKLSNYCFIASLEILDKAVEISDLDDKSSLKIYEDYEKYMKLIIKDFMNIKKKNVEDIK